MLRLLVLLLFAGPVFADPPKLKELSPAPKLEPLPNTPIAIEAGKYRWYSVEGYTGPLTLTVEGSSVGIKEVDKPLTLFGVVSGQADPGEYPISAGAMIVWGRDAGPTKVQAWGVVDGKAKLLLSLMFQVGPRPPPDTDPHTEPVPVPTAKALWLVTVEDMQTRTADAAMVQGDTRYWESLRTKGHDFRQYDKSKGEGVNYAKKAALKGVALPAVLVFDKNAASPAEPLAIVPLPKTTAGLDALILKHGAK